MTWEYYVDEGNDETIYYHDGEEIIRLDGQNTSWKKQNIPAPHGEHYEALADEIQQTGTPKRVRMQLDWSAGFAEISDPY